MGPILPPWCQTMLSTSACKPHSLAYSSLHEASHMVRPLACMHLLTDTLSIYAEHDTHTCTTTTLMHIDELIHQKDKESHTSSYEVLAWESQLTSISSGTSGLICPGSACGVSCLSAHPPTWCSHAAKQPLQSDPRAGALLHSPATKARSFSPWRPRDISKGQSWQSLKSWIVQRHSIVALSPPLAQRQTGSDKRQLV